MLRLGFVVRLVCVILRRRIGGCVVVADSRCRWLGMPRTEGSLYLVGMITVAKNDARKSKESVHACVPAAHSLNHAEVVCVHFEVLRDVGNRRREQRELGG